MDSPAPIARIAASLKERVETILAEQLGARTSATVVLIASRTWLRTEPEDLVDAQLLGLTHGLAPLLEKLLGAEEARSTAERLVREARR